MSPPPLREFLRARRLIDDLVGSTPLRCWPDLGATVGIDVHAKHENLGEVRSFKLRGALYRMSLLTPDERARGVVTASTGNHGMAIAYAARRLGTTSVVVVPDGAAGGKVERARALGAEIRVVDGTLSDALEAAATMARAERRTFVEDGDDAGLMIGAGTLGLEILEQLPRAQVLLVPVGGGNLIAGVASCVKQLDPDVLVIGVQSEAAPSVHDSFRAGRVVRRVAETFAGGLAADYPGQLALDVLRDTVDDIVLVSEDDLRAAMRVALAEIGQVLEGAGAAALAGLARHGERFAGQTVVAVLSGGNAEPEELLAALR